ncbi:FMN-linked oxidoreductase [Choiromyces venosus 120613-1]|uniref:FMN-linked oxidoreductase n=1 Tax=Choiromyces venosus 120613-1 TaxID=1336337 RepID=A0A3N4IYW9_9PEZI|nr:FMN-linked oxidoreductase [Choiromyces venosus 120613-1]
MAGKCVLAPMVRTGELPTRLLALKYGADLVWGPETVDKGIIGAQRVVNSKINCIDFVKPQTGGQYDEKVVFRTCPTMEAGKLIFQLGTASPELAVEAAKIVVGDVAGIDVNSGCPKHFSIHSGMGAALLKNPDRLVDILTSLVTEVGAPNSVPISVKIRLLEPHSDTIDLVRRLCTTGISRVTVHCRTIPMRPREPAIRDVLSQIADVCHEAGIECFANGDVNSRAHAEELIEMYGVDGCMIARAAETNPSIFLSGEKLPWLDVAKEYVRTAIEVDNHFSNIKFCLSHIIPGKTELYPLISRSKTVRQICEILEIPYEPPTPRAEEKVVEKGKAKSSATAKAAGGGSVKHGGKKQKERGVGTHSKTIPEQEPQQAAIVT